MGAHHCSHFNAPEYSSTEISTTGVSITTLSGMRDLVEGISPLSQKHLATCYFDDESTSSQSEAGIDDDCSDSENETALAPGISAAPSDTRLRSPGARSLPKQQLSIGDLRTEVVASGQSAFRTQESDFLENMECGQMSRAADERTNHVMLVSLGGYCGPKLSFQAINRGAATLPFDWMRTKIEGLLHFMRNDFDSFFDVVESEPIPGTKNKVAYRNQWHSFWHDDPTDPAMRDTYQRRIARFKTVDAHSQPVLFVRAAGSTDELLRAAELLSELKHQFGIQARLLMLLDSQGATTGPALVEDCQDLLVQFLPSASATAAPYAEHVRSGLLWAAGFTEGSIDGMLINRFANLAAARRAAETFDSTAFGLGGIAAFAGAAR
mmetsp:Transcript_80701/g.227085  ORF Transcript_80701/g.227085 Transcript_80701/m.227085 type:complete len:380 (-) Transcript_80701:295-1434(-)